MHKRKVLAIGCVVLETDITSVRTVHCASNIMYCAQLIKGFNRREFSFYNSISLKT